MNLPVAVQISSPTPVLSTDDKLPSFDYRVFFIENVPGSYGFPPIADADPSWYPQQVGKDQDMWESVRTQWDGTPGLGQGAAEAAVEIWAALSFAQWDTETQTPGVISGKKPKKLLRKPTFETRFLEAPRLSAVVA